MSDKEREWTTFGRYVLLDKIGVGGMAEIFRAKTFGAAGFEKEFAIKLILPSLIGDKEFVDMFIDEAKIAVSLYHANIVQVFDLGQLENQYYIAMEFVHGKDLLDVLARCAELEIHVPLHLVLFITMEMLKGLDFAHRARNSFGDDLGIIHRDVSPSNVLISYAGDVKIGDFGVAKAAMKRSSTESGTLKGKVGYMSPEQVIGDGIDHRSDIFSAGIVFFEALSMSRLFAGGSDLDVMLKVRDADINESLLRAEPMPSDLRDIVKRSLSRYREERYQSAGEFYQALQDFCFKHNIRVTESDLSNFMRRLFAEEIEQEKARRRSDPHAPVVSLSAQQNAMNVPLQHSVSDTLEDSTGSIAQTLSRKSEVSERRFRYRDAAGKIFGPMGLAAFVDLVANQPAHASERAAVLDGPWLDLGAFDELADVLARRAPAPPAPVPRPAQPTNAAKPPIETGKIPAAGAVVLKPSRKIEVIDDIANADTIEFHSLKDPLENLTNFDSESSYDGELTDEETMERVSSKLSINQIAALKQEYTTYEGTLNDVSFARMIARLHRIKSTGRLHTIHGNIEKSTFFNNGEIILVESNRSEERLGTFLLKRKYITQEQLEMGLARLSEWGGRLGDALVATGALPAHEIFTLLSDQMAEKLLDIFTWTLGSFAYYENQDPEVHGYPLDVNCYDILVRGCREYVTLESLVNQYRDRIHVSMFLRQPAPIDINMLKLRTNEARVAAELQNGMSLHGLLRRFPPSQRALIYRTVYLLHQSELLTFEYTTEEPDFPGSLIR